MKITPAAQLVRRMLDNPNQFQWSVQGLGMLRAYINERLRLHIWSPSDAVENVSVIHDHPWHFTSQILWGSVKNILYSIVEGEATHHEVRIKCGAGSCVVSDKSDVKLMIHSNQLYEAGDIYSQKGYWLHESQPEDGTVTLIEREFLGDSEHAMVYFPRNTEWVSAEPRPATKEEVEKYVTQALKLYDSVR